MNIPQIYLVEPYNAYAPKGKKKHWMQEVEEQALLAKIIAEQQARQQAELQQIIQEAKSRTLPPQAPPESTPTIVGNTSGAGSEGAAGSAPGGGGMPVWDFFHANIDSVNFDRSPSSGAGPLTVNFTNLTTTPQFDSYNWYFTQDGVTTTSTDINPTVVFQTGSTDPTVITASLQVTNSVTGEPGGSSPEVYTLVSVPTVTAAFTFATSSNVAPFNATFTNGSSTNSQTPPTLAYLWTFTYDNGTTTSSSISTLYTPPVQIVNSGSFTASLQATGSYGIASIYTQSFSAPSPTLNVSFTVVSSSNIAPALVTLTPTITYDGGGTLSGQWRSGEYVEGGSEYTLPSITTWVNRLYDTRSAGTSTGSFTASLEVTESSYGINAFYTRSFYLSMPTLIVQFITQSFGFGGAENSYMEPVTMSYTSSNYWNGNSPVTVLWNFGSSSFYATALGTQTGTTASIGPHLRADYGAGSYTASMQMTGSYGLSGIYTQSFTVGT